MLEVCFRPPAVLCLFSLGTQLKCILLELPVLFMSCPIFILPISYFLFSARRLSTCRHILASAESGNVSSNLPGAESGTGSFRETPCSVTRAKKPRRQDRRRPLFSRRHPRTAARPWAAPRAASRRPRSCIRTLTVATTATPAPYPRTPRTTVRD